jgi:hypothetical protein
MKPGQRPISAPLRRVGAIAGYKPRRFNLGRAALRTDGYMQILGRSTSATLPGPTSTVR